jgi:hypothetical protein
VYKHIDHAIYFVSCYELVHVMYQDNILEEGLKLMSCANNPGSNPTDWTLLNSRFSYEF